MSQQLKNFLHLNLALVIIATAGPLGNYIQLPPEVGIFSRTGIAMIAIFIFIKFKKIPLKFNFKQDGLSFFFCSLLMAIHWVSYFYALQMAGAGLGVISLFTFPIFTTLLEPVLRKTKFNFLYILLGVWVLFGLYILTPDFNFGNKVTLGITMGVFSAISFSIRNILMKDFVEKYHSTLLMFYQNGWVALMLLPVLFFVEFRLEDWMGQLHFLIFLGVVTTAIGHTYLVNTFQYFSATSVSLLSCIQPIYVMMMAFFFLGEIPKFNTIIGGLIIISAVVLETLISKKTKVS